MKTVFGLLLLLCATVLAQEVSPKPPVEDAEAARKRREAYDKHLEDQEKFDRGLVFQKPGSPTGVADKTPAASGAKPAPAGNDAFIATGRIVAQPLETLVIGELTYEQVKLTFFQNNVVKFSHALGNKTIPLVALTKEQVDALNSTNDKVVIKPGNVDLTPPSAEAARRAVELIQKAGDVDGLLPNGNTPLIEAASLGDAEMVKALITRDADVNLRIASDQTAVSVAAAGRQSAVLRVLRDAGARAPDLMAAILAGDDKVAKELVLKNRDLLKAVDREGMTPLMRATAENQPDVIAALASLGASVNETGMTQGMTPLIIASARGHESSVQLLLSRGAAIDSADENGWTPLIHAADGGHATIVHLLLTKGANYKLQDKAGATALAHAEAQKHADVAGLLQTHIAKLAPPPPAAPSTSTVSRAAAGKSARANKPAAAVKSSAGAKAAAPAGAKVAEPASKGAAAAEKSEADEKEKKPAPSKILVLLVYCGLLLCATGHIWLMVVGYQENPFWAVGMFFLDPIVGFFFTMMHPRAGLLPFGIHITGFLILYGIPALHGMAPIDFLTAA